MAIMLPRHLHPEGYFAYSRFLKSRFGERVQKIPLALGLPCPNKDGTISQEGCIFCDEYGSGPLQAGGQTVGEQLRMGMERSRRKGTDKFIAYFQANTSTAAPVAQLHRHGEEILAIPEIVGISIGTRPDCLPRDHLELLGEWNSRTFLQVELGLQSIRPPSLTWLRRHHTLEQFESAFASLKERGLRVCVHMILGIPGEGEAEAAAAARYLSAVGADGVKVHPLHVLKKTPLADLYQTGGFTPLTMEAYVRLAVVFLEHLDDRIVVQRLTGDRERELFIAPEWALDKAMVLRGIREELLHHKAHQGSARVVGQE